MQKLAQNQKQPANFARIKIWIILYKVEAAVFHIISTAGKTISSPEWDKLVTDRRPVDSAINEPRPDPTNPENSAQSESGRSKVFVSVARDEFLPFWTIFWQIMMAQWPFYSTLGECHLIRSAVVQKKSKNLDRSFDKIFESLTEPDFDLNWRICFYKIWKFDRKFVKTLPKSSKKLSQL